MVQKEYWTEVRDRVKDKEKEKNNNKKFNVLLFIILTLSGFGIHCFLFGKPEAMKELLVILIYAIPALILTPIISIIWRMAQEPALMHDGQKKIIEKYQVDQLKIELIEFKSINDNGNPGLDILIKNCGTYKIVDLEARIDRISKYYLDPRDEIRVSMWIMQHSKSDNFLEESVIRPDKPILGRIITYSNDFSEVKFGKLHECYLIGFEEVIYKVFLIFAGQIEGEKKFRNKILEVDLYVNPSKKLILSTPLAITSKLIKPEFEKKYKEYCEKEKEELDRYIQ